MQIQRTQGYNKNFNGLLKFNNITINPNHITKSKVYTSFHEMKVNRQNPYHGYYNTYLQERDVHLKGVETPRIRQWFEKHRNILKVLVNDPKDGLTIKEFDETPLQHTDKFLGFNFHELKFLNMTGKFQLLNGKTYAFENASYLIQNPTLKEINIPMIEAGVHWYEAQAEKEAEGVTQVEHKPQKNIVMILGAVLAAAVIGLIVVIVKKNSEK